MMRILLKILLRTGLTLTATYALICLILFLSQRSFIYFPMPASQTNSEAITTLNVADAALRISVRPHQGQDALIYFGGNAEEVSQSLNAFAAAFPDHAIYLMHYRGYGGSTGDPSEKLLHSDARALFDMVHAKHEHVVVIGRSLGSGVAIRLAATQPVTRLVLITPYDSMETVAKIQFPYFPIGLLLQDKFESWRYAPLIKAPTLIVAAANDEVIPPQSTMALFNGFSPGIARIKLIAGVGHNSISNSPDYMTILQGRE